MQTISFVLTLRPTSWERKSGEPQSGKLHTMESFQKEGKIMAAVDGCGRKSFRQEKIHKKMAMKFVRRNLQRLQYEL